MASSNYITLDMLFPSVIESIIFFIMLFAWVISLGLERFIIKSGDKNTIKTTKDRGSAILIYASWAVSICVALGFGGAGITLLPEWVFYPGIAFMVLGIIVREWAVMTLRTYFAFIVSVREDHKLLQTGPYRIIRHPAYAGSILTIVGLGIACRSWAGVLVLLAFSFIAYGYRIKVEENLLLKTFGEEYAQYMKRTKRLIPFIL